MRSACTVGMATVKTHSETHDVKCWGVCESVHPASASTPVANVQDMISDSVNVTPKRRRGAVSIELIANVVAVDAVHQRQHRCGELVSDAQRRERDPDHWNQG